MYQFSVSAYFLRYHSALCLILASLLFVGTTLLHEYLSNALIVPFKNMVGAGNTEYCFFVVTLLVMVCLLWVVRYYAAFRGMALVYWMILLSSLIFCTTWMMVTRIEMAHYPQYALLAALLRMGGLSPGGAYAAGQCCSLVDEGRQYLVHPRYTGYFDWNDLILNMLGLCMGLMLTHGCTVRSLLSHRVLRVCLAFLAILTLLVLGGLLVGSVVAYVPLLPGQEPTAFPLVEGGRVLALSLVASDLAFWRQGPFGTYCVLNVFWGMIVVPLCAGLLFWGYKLCVKKS